MNERSTRQTCSNCGTPMEPVAAIRAAGHQSRWWRCPNPACRTEWLLPTTSDVRKAHAV